MSDSLTHLDATGAARMVALDDKVESARMAIASARVRMAPATLASIAAASGAKGDVLQVARLAAISACKMTSTTIPLCHPVRLTAVEVGFVLVDEPSFIEIRVEVHAIDRTGPEMEAMHGAVVAALTIYDMCKAIDREMEIEQAYLLEKSGGKSGHWVRGRGSPTIPR